MSETAKHRRPSRLLRTAIVLAVLYGVGFALFLLHLPPPTDPAAPLRADGIVALTGQGGRLVPAVALLEKGDGARLLITGVNPTTTKAELRPLLHGGARFDCCADLGFQATDTRGNAVEAAGWARRHHYASLIVVTADYHMPRSLMEFAAAMPNITLKPFVVAPERESVFRRLPRLNAEYAKFVVSAVRLKLAEAVRGVPPAQGAAS